MLRIIAILVACLALAGCGGEAAAGGDAPDVLVDGGTAAFKRELGELRGKPVVVNQWASWCDPCRREFPYFQALARKYEGKVTFLGVNAQDARDDANAFLARFPETFESNFYDRDMAISRSFRGGRAWPTTAFYRADGKLEFTHQGAYRDEAALEADIQRYAFSG